jgi:hypothetical protein
MHAEINARRTEMLQQLTKLHNELAEDVKEFKTKNIESFTREIVESLTDMFTKKKQIHPKRLKRIETQLQSFKRKIEDVKEPNLILMNCDELKLVGEINFIRKSPCDEIEPTVKNDHSLELEAIKQKAVHHFPLRNNSGPLAASSQYILAFTSPSTLLLYDTITQLRSIDTKNNTVFDISWSDVMKLFLIVGEKLQTYDIVSNELVDSVIDNPDEEFEIWSVTTYCHDILLLYNIGIIKRYSWPSFTRKITWPRSEYLEKNNDYKAECIRLNSIGMLAMSIKQKDSYWRIDLFDTQMQRIHRGVPLTNTGTSDSYGYPFISLINNDWLVIDPNSRPRILSLVDKTGKLKQQLPINASNLALMGNKFLVLLSTLTGLHLYKLPQETKSKV